MPVTMITVLLNFGPAVFYDRVPQDPTHHVVQGFGSQEIPLFEETGLGPPGRLEVNAFGDPGAVAVAISLES